MTDLEHQLDRENTEFLQEKIRTNAYREDVAAVAVQILKNRNAAIPVPETEEELTQKVKLSMRLSTQMFFTVLVWVAVVYFFEPTTAQTVIFGLILLVTLTNIRSKNKK